MYLKGVKTKARSFKHYLGTVDLAKPMEPESLLIKVNQLREGKNVCNEILEAHLRLILQIVGRYYAALGSEAHLDDLVSEVVTKIMECLTEIMKGNKKLEHDNITGYIVAVAHYTIGNYLLECVPIVPIPQSTMHDNKISPKSSTSHFGTLPVRDIKLTKVDFYDLLNKAVENDPLGNVVVKLRSSGMTDEEVANVCKITKSEAFRIRKRVEEKFINLEKK